MLLKVHQYRQFSRSGIANDYKGPFSSRRQVVSIRAQSACPFIKLGAVAGVRECSMKLVNLFLKSGILAGVMASWTVPALAFCGFYAGKADASLFNEASQVIVARDGTRTVLAMQNDYKGPLTEFALVVPTPVVLEKGQVRVAEKLIFDRLDAYSSPRLAEYHDNDPCQMDFNWGRFPFEPMVVRPAPAAAPLRKDLQLDRDKALGVKVENQYTLGEYDIVNLSASQSDGLETWLIENGYKLPKGAGAALKPYINQGMKFFVAKVNIKEQAKTGYSNLRPLQFAFESEKFMLPMRLGMLNAPPDKAQDLIVYMLTKNGRVESSNYRTVKLPANENLPFFIKPAFKDVYKALFDNTAQREDYKVVFTEYFWDMAWCDPCAANPLSGDELRRAGAFWVSDDNSGDSAPSGTSSPVNPGNRMMPRPVPPGANGGQPVVLTRLHVRYTPRTFPEDLMFVQTKDRQNWQARYVIQNPYASSLAQCSAKTGAADCEAMCKVRVPSAQKQLASGQSLPGIGSAESKDEASLTAACINACKVSKQGAYDKAVRYYERDLPQRLSREKQSLARLTGWSLADIEAMPNAQKFSTLVTTEGPGTTPDPVTKPVFPQRPWWNKLFDSVGESVKNLGNILK